ncbi:translation initiation factor III [Actinoplanes sp. NPDC023714]|uniref:translation initiation factor III n=1 Tax=Actinoplanes sp. NPDC023714 TaxID=3154322 RepID=UPI0033FCE4D9
MLLVVSVLAALWAVAMMTRPGRVGYYYFFIYAEFYMGVISLVSLSITIMVGLVATDRLVLSIRQRVLLQSTHRTTGLIAVTALFVHVWTKYAEEHIRLIDIAIPFLLPGNGLYVGLGTISGWIMVLVMWTGIARSKFIGRGKPWMWRGIHSISYLMWPIALTHGLSAGRPAATWVTVSYVVCVLGVLVGLAVRLSVSLNRKKDFSSAAGTGIKPVGQLVPTGAAPKRRGRRGEPTGDLMAPAGPAATTAAWVPAAPPVPPAPPAPPMSRPVSPAPMQAAPSGPVPVSPAPAGYAPADFAPADFAPAGYPAELEAPAPRQRRSAEDDDRYDTSTRAMSRRAIEDERYRYDDEPAPRSRGGRAQEMYDEGPRRGRRFDDDEPAPRGRRDDLEATGTRMRRDDLEATGTRMRRDDLEATGTRMRRDEIEATGTRMRRDDLEATGTRMRRDEIEATGTRMRRDDLESTGTRMRRYADDEPPARGRRREPEYDDSPRRRRDDDYDEVPRQRAARYEEEPRGPRYADEEPPRRRARDDGRHSSRSQFVDLADGQWGGEPDDSPTLVEAAPRRGRRAEPVDRARRAEPLERESRGGRRGRDDDDDYFSQLRGDVREAN